MPLLTHCSRRGPARSAVGGGEGSFLPVSFPVLSVVLNELEARVRPAVSGVAGLVTILRAETRVRNHGLGGSGLKERVMHLFES